MKTTQDALGLLLAKQDITPTWVRRLKGGFNCAIYIISDTNNNRFVAKRYKVSKDDERDRTIVEYQSMRYLWSHGIVSIPQPICASIADHIAIYRHIDGKKFIKGQYSYHDINEALNLWRRLHKLSKYPDSEKLYKAKEASFSLFECMKWLDWRLMALLSLPKRHETTLLHTFLTEEFTPLYRQMKQFVNVEAKRAGIDIHATLSRTFQTLSPSDFGFHNALRSHNGIIFYDFEYFGWDDPAKMISDFFLHPKMDLPYKFRDFFFKGVYQVIGDPNLPTRLALFYILLSFKWSLIMLNAFSEVKSFSHKRLLFLQEQLTRAKKQLNETIEDLEIRSFPLSLLQ